MYLYPIWVRLWHFINAILILILIITGIIIWFVGEPGSAVAIENSGASVWHKIASILLMLSYAGFVAGNIITANGSHYRIIRKNFFHDLGLQIRYTLAGRFRKEKNPFPASEEQKFNPLQKLAYLLLMYGAVPVIILSGAGLMISGDQSEAVYLICDAVHIITGLAITIFLFLHIYMAATLGSTPSSGLRSIISGYAEAEE